MVQRCNWLAYPFHIFDGPRGLNAKLARNSIAHRRALGYCSACCNVVPVDLRPPHARRGAWVFTLPARPSTRRV